MKEEAGQQQSEANGDQPTNVTPDNSNTGQEAVPEDGGVVRQSEGDQQVNEENSADKEACVETEDHTVAENDNEPIKPSDNNESNDTENNVIDAPENGQVDTTEDSSAVNESESSPADESPSTNGEVITNGENTDSVNGTGEEMEPKIEPEQVNGDIGPEIENGEADKSEIIDEPSLDEVQFPRERRLTAYERLSNDLSGDHKVQKEITLGKRIGFYRIRGELGSGNFSQVKMGIHALTKEKVAVKILDKTKLDQKTQRLLSREISSMDKMHHPNIIRLYEVVETLAKLHIVMEYAAGGELFHKISNEGKIAEPEAKIVYAQVLAAIDHMHSKNIIHRDLKAENVFYAGPHFVKVGDFGFSTCSAPDQTLNTFCGSPPYAAPELFKDEHYFGVFVDIWAMGILLYFMVCGVMPFRADTVSKLKKCILEGNYVIPNFVSDSCQFLIRGILKPIPHDRFSLLEIKRSDWLEGQDFPEELPPYNMNPSGEGAELTEEELEVRGILHDLGINEAHIKECHGKDSRSSINGTYRIVLHKVQRKRSGNVEMGPDFEPESLSEKRDIKKETKNKKTSKFCVLL